MADGAKGDLVAVGDITVPRWTTKWQRVNVERGPGRGGSLDQRVKEVRLA